MDFGLRKPKYERSWRSQRRARRDRFLVAQCFFWTGFIANPEGCECQDQERFLYCGDWSSWFGKLLSSSNLCDGAWLMLWTFIQGKSTFLQSLLGEVDLVAGEINRPLKAPISYCSQDAWLRSGETIRSEIEFLSDHDAEWYRTVVNACALEIDFEVSKKHHPFSHVSDLLLTVLI